MNQRLENKRGITLVALVITIIILLILAGVAIASLGGENGLIEKAKLAKEKYSISESKEKLEFEITELRIEQEGKGENLKKEDLPKINNDEIDVGNTDSFPIEVICGKYKFNVDENFNVTYVGEADGTIITYTTDPEGYTNKDRIQILIKVSNSKGIKEIVYPDGDKLEIGGVTERGIDYTVTANGKYTFKVVDNENKEVVKDVVIDQIDKLAPLDFTPEVQKNESSITIKENAQDAEPDGTSIKSGIDYCEYYLKSEAQTEYIKYDKNKIDGLAVGKYKLYVIAYDRAGNSKKSSEVEFSISLLFKTISTGDGHILAIDLNGNLWACGSNDSGQLGDGSHISKQEFIKIKGGTKFIQISAGYDNSFAIDEEGNLWGWGSEYGGKLGNGKDTNSNIYWPSLPVLIDGEKKFSTIVAAKQNSYAIDKNGNIWSWGSSFGGALGDGIDSIDNDRLIPGQVTQDIEFTEIAGGSQFALAIDKAKRLWSWGNNYYGQLGDGTTKGSNTPKKITTEIKFTQISAGNDHSLALDEAGNIWSWGRNDYGQVGNRTKEDVLKPMQITSGTKFVKIESFSYNNLAIDENGNIWSWGRNNYGQVGNGTKEDVLEPIQITNGTKFTQMGTLYSSSVAIDENYEQWTWGGINLIPTKK